MGQSHSSSSSSRGGQQGQQQLSGYPPATVYSLGPPALGGGFQAHYQPHQHLHPPPQLLPATTSFGYGGAASQFPSAYPPVQPQQVRTNEYHRTATIKNQVNLRKKSLQLRPVGDRQLAIAFTFDASTACRVTTFVHAREDNKLNCKITVQGGSAAPAVPYGKGMEQHFPPPPGSPAAASQHCVDLTKHYLADLCEHTPAPPTAASHSYPLIIRLEALTEEGRAQEKSLDGLEPGCELPHWVQTQSTYAKLVKEEDGSIGICVLGQKIWVKGESYELQEIYGMEQNRGVVEGTPTATREEEDGFEDVEGNECVICMSAPRNTAAMPCRHMCMCHSCASTLRSQTNKCPICRLNISSLLYIKLRGGAAP